MQHTTKWIMTASGWREVAVILYRLPGGKCREIRTRIEPQTKKPRSQE